MAGYSILGSHAANVERYNGPGESKRCKVVLADWPYECVAKDKHPNHVVYVCETHSVWWHSPDWQPTDVPDWQPANVAYPDTWDTESAARAAYEQALGR